MYDFKVVFFNDSCGGGGKNDDDQDDDDDDDDAGGDDVINDDDDDVEECCGGNNDVDYDEVNYLAWRNKNVEKDEDSHITSAFPKMIMKPNMMITEIPPFPTAPDQRHAVTI